MYFFVGYATFEAVLLENIQMFLFTKVLEFSIFMTRGYE